MFDSNSIHFRWPESANWGLRFEMKGVCDRLRSTSVPHGEFPQKCATETQSSWGNHTANGSRSNPHEGILQQIPRTRKRLEKGTKKKSTNVPQRTPRSSPPLPPTPAEPPRRTPQSRDSAKALCGVIAFTQSLCKRPLLNLYSLCARTPDRRIYII